MARPTEAEARLSFAALRDLLEPIYDEVSGALRTPQRQALDVALLRAAPGDVPQRIGAIEAGFASCLAALAADGRPVVAIDDVQWLDRPSWRVLAYAARRLSSTGTTLILTRRTGADADGFFDIDGALHDLRLTRIDAGPLSLGAIHAILLGQLGVPFPRPVLRRIHEASRGNAFYALELGRVLLDRDRGLGPGETLPVPDDIRMLVRERLRPLSEPTQTALLLAAAMPDPTVQQLEAAGGSTLDEAIEAGLITVDGNRSGSSTHCLPRELTRRPDRNDVARSIVALPRWPRSSSSRRGIWPSRAPVLTRWWRPRWIVPRSGCSTKARWIGGRARRPGHGFHAGKQQRGSASTTDHRSRVWAQVRRYQARPGRVGRGPGRRTAG